MNQMPKHDAFAGIVGIRRQCKTHLIANQRKGDDAKTHDGRNRLDSKLLHQLFSIATLAMLESPTPATSLNSMT